MVLVVAFQLCAMIIQNVIPLDAILSVRNLSDYRRVYDCNVKDVCYGGSNPTGTYSLSSYGTCKALMLCSWYCSRKVGCVGFDIRSDNWECRLFKLLSRVLEPDEKCVLYVNKIKISLNETKNNLLINFLRKDFERDFAVQLSHESHTSSIYVDGILSQPYNFSDDTLIYVKISVRTLAVVVYRSAYNHTIRVCSGNGLFPILTDRSWKCCETYQAGWFQTGFDDSAWSFAEWTKFQNKTNCIKAVNNINSSALFCRKSIGQILRKYFASNEITS
ncbi:hypothetical protein HELRODRAFT_175305 [Helobdella robusta]|uniref:Apple domain-containing protein n=1 Tax=Helobdella robusta TaxID=6412 RepID=T1F945_HELRO|nr:hypothetical protein HELRODRAFT_175305 [Helobdella robusta]ESO00818.1 hypothetical protein HELRODRAFT_175305 [Helobdella robusta]